MGFEPTTLLEGCGFKSHLELGIFFQVDVSTVKNFYLENFLIRLTLEGGWLHL